MAQLRALVAGTLEVKFQPIRNDVERYSFIAGVLGRFAYRQLGGVDKACYRGTMLYGKTLRHNMPLSVTVQSEAG